MAEKRRLTKSGYKALEDELRQLIEVEKPKYLKELTESRAQGDLSENADYDAARKRQAEVEGRILEIENILRNSEVIESKSTGTKKVALGSTVTIKNLSNDKIATYVILDTVESDPFNGKISQTCALGAALIGKVVGATVEVKAINPYKVEILEIKAA